MFRVSVLGSVSPEFPGTGKDWSRTCEAKSGTCKDTLGEVKRKSLKILANFSQLMAILPDLGHKFKSCKIFELYAYLTRYLRRFLKEQHFAANILQDL